MTIALTLLVFVCGLIIGYFLEIIMEMFRK
jgi:hypothetical protein